MPDVPFLCHFRRAVPMLDTAPYNEIATYCKAHRGSSDRVFRVLDYFDGQFFAERTTARSLFSVGLMDNICPPRRSTPPTTASRPPKTSACGTTTTTKAAAPTNSSSASASPSTISN